MTPAEPRRGRPQRASFGGTGTAETTASAPARIEVKRYRKPDGYATRFWAVYVDGELLAVVVYRKGAQAIADMLRKMRFSKEAVNAA